jgi:hypothetical protein
MVEKTVNETAASKREQFEFILTINDNIICQRYFRINGFKRETYSSLDLIETIDHCVYLIDQDLKAKTGIYLYSTAPQVLEDEKEMEVWAKKHRGEKFERPIYVVLRNSDVTYVWDGNEMSVYEKNFNKADYVADKENEQPCILKFSFRDNGREVCSKVWDGSIYPRFIRTNIDISNSKNKYKAEGVFMPVERSVIDEFIEAREDLIPVLVKELCSVCSYDDVNNYGTYVDYGDKTYDLSYRRLNNKYYRTVEGQVRKKTLEYFKRR